VCVFDRVGGRAELQTARHGGGEHSQASGEHACSPERYNSCHIALAFRALRLAAVRGWSSPWGWLPTRGPLGETWQNDTSLPCCPRFGALRDVKVMNSRNLPHAKRARDRAGWRSGLPVGLRPGALGSRESVEARTGRDAGFGGWLVVVILAGEDADLLGVSHRLELRSHV
jgi:hypothetical protein